VCSVSLLHTWEAALFLHPSLCLATPADQYHHLSLCTPPPTFYSNHHLYLFRFLYLIFSFTLTFFISETKIILSLSPIPFFSFLFQISELLALNSTVIFSVSVTQLWTLYVVPCLSLVGCAIQDSLPAARVYPRDQDTPSRQTLLQLEHKS
jgi:hypothetical protein